MFTIKSGSYCPVCCGVALADCTHRVSELDNRPYKRDVLADLRATIATLTAERDAARGAVEVLRRLWKQFEGVSVDIPEDSWEMVLDLHSSGKATAGQIRTALSHSPPAVSMEEVAEVLEGIVDHSIMPGTGDSSDDARVTAIWVLRTRAILTRIRARGGKEVQGAE